MLWVIGSPENPRACEKIHSGSKSCIEVIATIWLVGQILGNECFSKAKERGVWANIPPKQKSKASVTFSKWVYKQPKRARLSLNNGPVFGYDFVHCGTDDGKVFRALNIIDEFSRECLSIKVKRKQNSGDVIDAVSDLVIMRACRTNQVGLIKAWLRAEEVDS